LTQPSSQQEAWRFGRRSGGCTGCGAAFQPGKDAVSAIYAAEATFERRDWCGACFQDPARRGTPFSWWSAVVPEPEKKKAVFDLGVAKEFLQRLLREDDPARRSLRYLLTLLLLRKRAVVLVGQEPRDGVDVLAVRVPPDEETVHEIPCVELDEAETERLRDELGRLFQLS
jgi:hypothetical protein